MLTLTGLSPGKRAANALAQLAHAQGFIQPFQAMLSKKTQQANRL
jgi:hypothetical protein